MWQLTKPIALFIFNRSETVRRVFEVIEQVKPPKLLVVADGPRAGNPDDVAGCQSARAVTEMVNWDCTLLVNYSETNLGCKQRVSSGLDWVFNEVEEAIILEDDCLPHLSFFRFCDQLLSEFRQNENVLHISGTNPLPQIDWPESIIASRLVPIWGWATWRRAWRYYTDQQNLWPTCRDHCNLDYFGEFESRVQADIDHYFGVVHDMWSGEWALSCLRNNAVSLIPKTNLVQNIGFGDDATHTKLPISLGRVPVQGLTFPLVLPSVLVPNRDFDRQSLQRQYQGR